MIPFTFRDRDKIARIKKILTVLLCVLLVILLALFEFLFPFKTLLPATRIPPRAEGEMRVHFLDVGEGDCAAVEFPDGDVLLIDSGEGAFQTENMLVRYLKGLRAASYSMLATHADFDHYGGFSELIETFGATNVYLPKVPSDSAAYERFLAAAEKSGAEVQTLTRYSVIARPSGAYAVCISPTFYELDDAEESQDKNESSIVLFLSYGGVNLLFGADISADTEAKLLREYSLLEGIFDCGEYRVRLEETNVLKVSHHGSAYSSSEEWLSLLSPEVAVVTSGRGNNYGHPAAESIERLEKIGAKIYRTDELGNIVLGIKDGNYNILE